MMGFHSSNKLRTFALLAGIAVFAAPASAETKDSTMHYLQALLLQHQGEYAQALKEYELASEADPHSAYILEQAAQLALETNQPDLALKMARHLAAADPKQPKAWFILGNVRWARGELDQAQKAFEEAIKLKPDFPDAMFALGHLLAPQFPDKAKKYLQDYLKTNPDRAAEAHYQVAIINQSQGHWDQAISHLRTSVEIDPGFQHARYTLAQFYEVRRDTDAALGQYLELAETEPDNLTLLDHIGELYFLKGDAQNSRNYFLKVSSASAGDPGACFWLAVLAEQKNDFQSAARYLSQSSALKDDPDLSLRLSYYLSQAGRVKEATESLDAAHKKWPDNPELAYFLALGYDDLKEYDKAIALLQQVLQRDPQFRDARFQLGTLYEKLDRMEDCEREFRALLDRHPDDAAALNYLGYSLTDRGLKLEEAAGLIHRAVQLDPNNGAYADSLGWSYFKRKRYKEALVELRHSLELLGDDATVWDHLGQAYLADGQAEQAWRAWKSGLAYDPSNAALSSEIASVEKSWKPDVLGKNLLDYFEDTQGHIGRLAAFCSISGTVWKNPIQAAGLLSFQDGNLNLELLGPLFVPMFRVSLSSSDAFSMDDLPWDGPSREALNAAVREMMASMRDYFDGRIFRETPAVYHPGWRTHWISTPMRRLFLSADGSRLTGFRITGGGSPQLSLGSFRRDRSRAVSEDIRWEGKEFSMSFHLSEPNVQFAAPPAAAKQ